jgi:hypothetical protein
MPRRRGAEEWFHNTPPCYETARHISMPAWRLRLQNPFHVFHNTHSGFLCLRGRAAPAPERLAAVFEQAQIDEFFFQVVRPRAVEGTFDLLQ